MCVFGIFPGYFLSGVGGGKLSAECPKGIRCRKEDSGNWADCVLLKDKDHVHLCVQLNLNMSYSKESRG